MEEPESLEMFQRLTEVVMEAVTKSEHENGINELLAMSGMTNFQPCLKRVLEELMSKYVKVVSFSWDKLKRRSFCSFLGKLLIISCQPEYSFCVIGNFVLDTLSNWIHQDLLQITTEEYEVYVDCLCVLLPLIGEDLEEICPERLEVMFSSIQDVVLDSHLPRFIKSNMLNLLLLRKSNWKHLNKDSRFVNRGRESGAVEPKEAEKGEEYANNLNTPCDGTLTVDNCLPASGDNLKAGSETIMYDFVEKLLKHLGWPSHLPAFVKHGVCDHVMLSSSFEDLPGVLKSLRLGDQLMKEITLFMAGFHLAFSGDRGSEMFSKESPVLLDKGGNSQTAVQQSHASGSYCSLVEHCEAAGPQSSEWPMNSSVRKLLPRSEHFSDPCNLTRSCLKNSEIMSSCCILHQSQSSPKIYSNKNNKWDLLSQAPTSFLPSGSTLSSKEQNIPVVEKDGEPPASLRIYQEKNSVSEVDVSFIQKMSKRLEEQDKWKTFLSTCKSVHRFK